MKKSLKNKFLQGSIYLARFLLIFSHPDYTVGSGISPDHAKIARGLVANHITAGRESHPALKIVLN
jgi:hypothetical protein